MKPFATLAVILFACPVASAEDKSANWKPAAAAKSLDEREKTWLEAANTKRGQGSEQTTCVSCHSALPYILARPVLRKQMKADTPTEYEQKLLARTVKRTENWKDLDTPKLGLFYDFDEDKKKESWGTEAVLNAVVLAFEDHHQGKSTPSEITRKAFANLWKTQIQTGDNKGAWDWLNFGLEPWEAKGSRYYGTALASIAVGTAPGYASSKADAKLNDHLGLLREYLKTGLPQQNLFNRTWALWASAKLEGVLGKDEQKKVIEQLFAQQRDDGGWSLPSLGAFVRHDGTSQESSSDGYATGLVLHVLQTAGVPADDNRVAKGIAWLKRNQADTGGWRGVSVNKKRDPATNVGQFMSDAATAFAVLALSHR
jgi:squalene-hopene/tetraprenyl-beta-curcumene cyclase